MTNLTPTEAVRRQQLTEKLSMRTLTRAEAEELKGLLEKEKVQATSLGDVIAILGIAFLIGLVIAFLADDR
jgi:thiol:disulfide interchange protein